MKKAIFCLLPMFYAIASCITGFLVFDVAKAIHIGSKVSAVYGVNANSELLATSILLSVLGITATFMYFNIAKNMK